MDEEIPSNPNPSNSNAAYLRNAFIYKWIHRLILISLSFTSLYFGADTNTGNDNNHPIIENITNCIIMNTNGNDNVKRNKIFLIISAFGIAFLIFVRLDKYATINKIQYKQQQNGINE